MTRAERAARITARLREVYPEAHCELAFRNPLELLVATILSAQCTDKRVNLVTPELFRRQPDAHAFAAVPQEELEAQIRSTGFFRSKAKAIRAAARDLVEKHGGQVPRTMPELFTLPGVGRKTANVVLGNAFGIDAGVVVDTHVGRLARRFRLTRHTDAVKIERDLMKLIPRADWTPFSHWLIWHGRRRCRPAAPIASAAKCRNSAPAPSKLAHSWSKARRPLRKKQHRHQTRLHQQRGRASTPPPPLSPV